MPNNPPVAPGGYSHQTAVAPGGYSHLIDSVCAECAVCVRGPLLITLDVNIRTFLVFTLRTLMSKCSLYFRPERYHYFLLMSHLKYPPVSTRLPLAFTMISGRL